MINPTEQVRAVLGVVQELVRNVYPDRHYLCSPSYYKRVYELIKIVCSIRVSIQVDQT